MVRMIFGAMLTALCPLAMGLWGQSPSTDGPILPVARRTAAAELLSPTLIRVDASLVLIPANVTTASGVPVTNLSKNDFRLFEDNVEQGITFFRQDDAPISIGLLFDTSGSMHDKMRKACEAAAAFFKTANPEDEFFLVAFGDRPHLAMSFTPDSDLVYRRVERLHPSGRTSLLDAIDLALQQMKNARHQRKALVVVSDGGDNFSRRSPAQVKNELLESDVQLYAMGIFEPSEVHPHTTEERDGPKLLEDLATHTGGRNYAVDNLEDLPAISTRISRELRSEYVLGYSPAGTGRDGKYHRVRVSLAIPGDVRQFHTAYRRGYYAPAQ